jgi:hypothetical protein
MHFHGKLPPITAEYAKYPVPLRRINPLSEAEATAAYGLLKDPGNIAAYGEPDKTYPSAVCYYQAPFLTETAAAVKRHVRPFLDYDIVETYWYARLYGMGDKLEPHVDRGACFVSVSLCFGYDFNALFPEGSRWPIGALADDGKGGEREELFDLKPGEGILYPGCSAPHWRDVFLGQNCGQAFFHYVPAAAQTFGEYFGDIGRGGGTP